MKNYENFSKESFSIEDTLTLAAEIAQQVKAGDVFCLCGNLGAGKTAFAQGFARGLGIEGYVTSPTFTIMQTYENGRLPMYHFDLYRLAENDEDEIHAEILDDIGFEEYLNSDGVSLIEWAVYAKNNIPAEAVWVNIEPDESKGEGYRMITMAKVKEGLLLWKH